MTFWYRKNNLRISHIAGSLNISNEKLLELLCDEGFEHYHAHSVLPQFILDTIWKKLSKARFTSELELNTIAFGFEHKSQTQRIFSTMWENRFKAKRRSSNNFNLKAQLASVTIEKARFIEHVNIQGTAFYTGSLPDSLVEKIAAGAIFQTGRQLIRAVQGKNTPLVLDLSGLCRIQPKIFHTYPNEEDMGQPKQMVSPFTILKYLRRVQFIELINDGFKNKKRTFTLN